MKFAAKIHITSFESTLMICLPGLKKLICTSYLKRVPIRLLTLPVWVPLYHLAFFTVLIFCLPSLALRGQPTELQWSKLPDLPPFADDSLQYGVSGAFAGTHNGVIIVAGGTNFPGAPPWEGGQKRWYADILVLVQEPDGHYHWIKPDTKLPLPTAYGASVSTPRGVLCMGGSGPDSIYNLVYFLKWDHQTRQILVDFRRPLPQPLSFISAALVKNKVYVAGGTPVLGPPMVSTKHFFSLDADQEAGWQVLPPWPGPGRLLPVMSGQSDGEEESLYIFSGQQVRKDSVNLYLTDSYRYRPSDGQWKKLSPVRASDASTVSVFGAPAIALGANHIAIFGGVTGRTNTTLESLNIQLARATGTVERERLQAAISDRLSKHPGFSREVLLYHTVTDRWTTGGQMPYPGVITSNAFYWQDTIILASGEISPGVRTAELYRAIAPGRKVRLGLADSLVLLAYFVVLLGIGRYHFQQQRSTEEYFRGGQSIPSWAAGLSLLGTSLSAITFMAVPAKTFTTDWAYFVLSMGILLVPPLVNRIFIPVYRRLNVTSAFEYLEWRYNKATRLIGSLTFILFQLGRTGIILYLPALALNIATGMEVWLCISLMGGISLIYTALGGIRAVIWTDVLQVIVLMGGALFCLFFIGSALDGGFAELFRKAADGDKFRLLNFALDFSKPTFWVVLLGGFFTNLITYSTDQTMVQRYLVTSDMSSARRSVWTNAVAGVPAIILFYLIGTALFVFYQANPQALLPPLQAPDAIFPWYIISQLPAGVSGLLIAAIFAAAMSSLSSSMNSASTVYHTDFHPLISGSVQSVRIARWATVIFGLAGMVVAFLFTLTDVKSIWDEFFKVIGLLTGGLGGIFLLGMISKRTNGVGALTGLLGSAVVQYYVSAFGLVHLLLFAVTGFVSSMVIAYSVSVFSGYYLRSRNN